MSLINLFDIFLSKKREVPLEEQVLLPEEQDKNKVNEIAKEIDDTCNYIVTMIPSDERGFQGKLKKLANTLRLYLDSRYCAIGKVDEKYVEDCTASWENNKENINVEKQFKQVKRVSVDNQRCAVCQCLSLPEDEKIKRFGENEIINTPFLSNYMDILGVKPENTTIILFRDKNKKIKGYIQLINSSKEIDFKDIEPFYESLTKLIFIIHHREASLFKKDYDFYLKVQGKIHNVDELLQEIMKYLSDEFNAGIISYRIPLLVGTDRHPIFYLRDCYVNVSSKINNNENEKIKNRYFTERLVKTKKEMGGVEKLTCKNHGFPVFLAEPKDSGIEIGVPQGVFFKKNTVIIPIIRNHSEKDKCINKVRENRDSLCENGRNCIARFEKYLGIFKLRILRSEDPHEHDDIPEEILSRLYNIAKHISVLLNAIVDKDENESLNKYQIGLNASSFTDYTVIKDFDFNCAKTIKNSTGAKVCAIYKYDKLSDEMVLSASSSETIKMSNFEGEMKVITIDSILKKTMENFEDFFLLNVNVDNLVFEKNEPIYYIGKEKANNNSMMLVPMKKQDGTQLGMILLIGKGLRNGDVSKTYWEQDKRYIKFMVDILSRIEVSNADMLVFLMKLSHELRKPITEIVYKNDLLFSTAERNKDNISKIELIECLKYNTDQCMMFKQIIGDIESAYYLRKGRILYSFQDDNVKACLLDVIRLFERGGGILDKGLTFDTHLTQMPQTMFVDKERIKQVFTNILKNAIQYSNSHSTITISYNFNEMDKCHEIDFRNYGIGIAEEEKEDIFKLWKRGEAAQKKRPNGTGMGLSIVKEIMKAHGGNCYVKRLNNPTIFTVSIPQKNNK